jgi:hypothetical protein
VEVRCVARKNDNAGWRIRLNLASVELVAKPMQKTPDITVYTRSSGCRCGINFTPEETLTLIT